MPRFNLYPAGEQGIPFSLMTQITPEVYQLTEHGEVLRWFVRDYLPEHPRPYTFRDITPDAAIIRFPDSDYGQRFIGSSMETGWNLGLYGSAQLPNSVDSEAWFGLWSLLTCGHTGSDSISYFKRSKASVPYRRPPKDGATPSLHSRPEQAAVHSFFTPMNNVVVYDHLVRYDHIKDIPLLFLTGTHISEETFQAVDRRIKEGATGVIWHNLAREHGLTVDGPGCHIQPRGAGKLVITDNFNYADVWQACWPHVPINGQIRYRFGDYTVVLHQENSNQIRIDVTGG